MVEGIALLGGGGIEVGENRTMGCSCFAYSAGKFTDE
jgi:hypothetical protein